MDKKNKQSPNKSKVVRVSKKDKEKLKGNTNWASLVAEERKNGFRK
ncbi:MAG: hypothetical protein ACRBCI_15960 [Cellvibrionaceae bacterium]